VGSVHEVLWNDPSGDLQRPFVWHVFGSVPFPQHIEKLPGSELHEVPLLLLLGVIGFPFG
jgi:hypothetical protein